MTNGEWTEVVVGLASFRVPEGSTSSVEHVDGLADVTRYFGGPGLVVAASRAEVNYAGVAGARRLTSDLLAAYDGREGFALRTLEPITIPGATAADAASFVWLSPMGEEVSSVCVTAVANDGRGVIVHACIPKVVDDDGHTWMRNVVSSIRLDSEATLEEPA